MTPDMNVYHWSCPHRSLLCLHRTIAAKLNTSVVRRWRQIIMTLEQRYKEFVRYKLVPANFTNIAPCRAFYWSCAVNIPRCLPSEGRQHSTGQAELSPGRLTRSGSKPQTSTQRPPPPSPSRTSCHLQHRPSVYHAKALSQDGKSVSVSAIQTVITRCPYHKSTGAFSMSSRVIFSASYWTSSNGAT